MQTKVIDNKQYVFCDWRRKFVRLTPEEWVRQQFLHRLVEELNYPAARIGVEVPLTDKRADAIVYRPDLTPFILLEFKADTVSLTQTVLDQIVVYNRQLHVPYLVLHNGHQTIIARVYESSLDYLDALPPYLCE